jgi:hypothetical protein
MKTGVRILCGIMLSLDSALILLLAFPHYHLVLLIGAGFVPVLIATVPLGAGRTLYSQLWDWLGWWSLTRALGFGVGMPLVVRKGIQLT